MGATGAIPQAFTLAGAPDGNGEYLYTHTNDAGHAIIYNWARSGFVIFVLQDISGSQYLLQHEDDMGMDIYYSSDYYSGTFDGDFSVFDYGITVPEPEPDPEEPIPDEYQAAYINGFFLGIGITFFVFGITRPIWAGC